MKRMICESISILYLKKPLRLVLIATQLALQLNTQKSTTVKAPAIVNHVKDILGENVVGWEVTFSANASGR